MMGFTGHREIIAYWQSSMHHTTLFLKGSAHTVLAGYWSEKLEKKKMMGNSLLFHQCIMSSHTLE